MALDLLFPNFDELIRTPEDVQRLNEAILQLAVQGKLVVQDPNDEPASELLKRVEAEKTQLIREGRIVKGKSMPPINSDQEPFDLPVHWVWIRLGTIAHAVQYGYTASADFSVMDVKFLRITDIQDDRVEWNKVPGCSIDVREEQKYLLRQNDILIARTGGTVGKSYLIENLAVKAVFASYLIRIVPPKDADARYIKLFLGSKLYWSQLVEQSKGTGQPNVNGVSLSQLIFPLPPLAEQQRIVAKVNELFAQTRALEARLRQAQEDVVTVNRAALHRLHTAQDDDQFQGAWHTIRDHFDVLYDDPRNVSELRQTILDLAVRGKLVAQDPKDEPAAELLKRIEDERTTLAQAGKIKKPKPLPSTSSDEVPYLLPSGWEWTRLADIGQTQTGTTPPTSVAEYYGSDFPFLKPSDLSERSIFSVNYANEGLSEIGMNVGRRIEPGSTLMVCIGGSISKVGYVNRVCSCNQQINFVTPFADLARVLVAYFLNSPYFRGEVLRSAPQTTLPILSKGKWESIPFPLPPIAEQQRIVAKVDQLMRLCDALESQLAQAEVVRGNCISAIISNRRQTTSRSGRSPTEPNREVIS